MLLRSNFGDRAAVKLWSVFVFWAHRRLATASIKRSYHAGSLNSMTDSRVQLQGRITTTTLFLSERALPRTSAVRPSTWILQLPEHHERLHCCRQQTLTRVAHHGGELPGYGGVGQYVFHKAATERLG